MCKVVVVEMVYSIHTNTNTHIYMFTISGQMKMRMKNIHAHCDDMAVENVECSERERERGDINMLEFRINFPCYVQKLTENTHTESYAHNCNRAIVAQKRRH